jgi:hypothetical protein
MAAVLSRITPSVEDPRFLNSIRLKTNSKRKLTYLAILSWYLPPEIGILLRLALEEYIDNKEDLAELDLLLHNRGEMLVFLQETSKWHSRDFFGNIANSENAKNCKHFFCLEFSTRKKPKRVQRHRGYRDKGTYRFDWEVHEAGEYRVEQMRLEEHRQAIQDTISLCRGFFFGG